MDKRRDCSFYVAAREAAGVANLITREQFYDYASTRNVLMDDYEYPGDSNLRKLYSLTGYDQKPEVVTEQELKDMIASGDVTNEIWRGVGGINGKQAGKFVEDFRSGDVYAGQGLYGNGSYFASEKIYAGSYGLGLIHAGIKKNAFITTYDDLVQQYKKDWQEYKRLLDSYGGKEDQSFFDSLEDRLLPSFETDLGRYATMKGYDGMQVISDIWVIWNRGALVVTDWNGSWLE